MLNLIPYRRSQEAAMMNPFRMFDELEKSFWGGMSDFKTDIQDLGDSYLLSADLPGFDKGDIHVDLDGDRLCISAERHSEFEQTDKKGNYIRCERSYGTYQRSFSIDGIQTDAIRAQYENGVLKLTLPKAAPAAGAARRLEIE